MGASLCRECYTKSYQSGNFDFPPASTRQAPASSLEEASAIVQEARAHRNVLRHRLDEVVRLRDHISDSDERRSQRMEPSAMREEIRRRQAAAQRADTLGTPASEIQAPISAMRSRPENVRQLARHRVRSRASPSSSGGTVQQAVERLNEASSNLSALLDQPIPRIGSPDMNSREYSGEAEVNRRRAKRRKLDSDPVSTGHLQGFSYGYRGQVVSGPLKMEIVTCDGGIHVDAAGHGTEYYADNVLRNDKSVYCTDKSECNLILRHMGETPFTLKKLIIKAPERNFTAPIQEGMVFISMDSSNLLSRTSQYQFRHASENEEFILFSDDVDENRPLSRRRDTNSSRTIPPPISNVIPRSVRHNNDSTSTTFSSNPFPLLDLGDDSTPPLRTSTPPETTGFTVTSTCDTPSSDEEEPSSAATLEDLYRRDHRPPAYDMSSDEETEDGLERAMQRARQMGMTSTHHGHRRSRRRAKPSKVEFVIPSSAERTQILPPHATFFIQRDSSVVSLKFDPPVSGRFILLKLWSPSKDQNIDIQSIVVHGFAGPRFFPATQMM